MVKTSILDYLDDSEFKSAGEISKNCDIPLPQVVSGLKALRQDGLISREYRSDRFFYSKATGEENKSKKKESPTKAVVKPKELICPYKIVGYKILNKQRNKIVTIFVDRKISAKSISFSLDGLTSLLTQAPTAHK